MRALSARKPMTSWSPQRVHRYLAKELGLFTRHPYAFHQSSSQTDRDPTTYVGASARVSYCYCWRCMTSHVPTHKRPAPAHGGLLVKTGSAKPAPRPGHPRSDPVFTDTELLSLLDRVELQARARIKQPTFRRYPTGIGRCSYGTRKTQQGLVLAWCTTCGSAPLDSTDPYKAIPPVCTGRPKSGYIDSLGVYTPDPLLE